MARFLSKRKVLNDFQIIMDNVCIQLVISTKLLGVTFDCKCTFASHIDELFMRCHPKQMIQLYLYLVLSRLSMDAKFTDLYPNQLKRD